jgi:hypothetical protein
MLTYNPQGERISYQLTYSGRREAGGKERHFREICPDSSGTLQKQNTRFDPPGLTIVVYISHEDRRPFRQAIDTIRDSGYKFQAFEQLHFTILGLFAGDLQEPLDRNKIQNLIDAIDAFFMGKHIGSIDVDFDFLRPGIFVGRPGYGDGTVVTMASESHDAITRVLPI